MLSNFSCLVFGNEPSKFENVSNGVNLFYSENDFDIEDIVEYANKLEPSKTFSKSDVIIKKGADGIDRYIIPYDKDVQAVTPVGINTIKENLKENEIVSNIELKENLLTYTIFDDINVSITETKNNGITTLNITEGDKIATIEFDSENNQLILNSSPVKINIIKALVFEKNPYSRDAGEWIYYGTMYPDIEAEDEIRFLPISALATILMSALSWGSSIAISLAANIIEALIDANSPTETLYCEREMYRPKTGYYAFKYYDYIYADPDYTEFLESNVWIQYE